ncbi:TIR domain-containing protein [Herbaspirillum sp. VT-16-41]|uniref:TIR domain-containing protein n=1 Tax=Herbaspirillum sp. VT-16-41 TaxID=1953765 RepID=UPI00098230E9|nr:TIR domain-containing protein [Herbaspirillum sp. VT-16-41]ONN64991.1 molecular chaperone Tir [Herbaspirillum sp. VT-16-41]
MGGGSNGRWSTLGDISALEKKAKETLQSGKRNVFISFATEDINEVNLLRAQAKNEKSDIEFNDHSVREPYNSERAEYIKQKIAERIARTSVCVVYLSDNTAQSDWVRWEVDKSVELGKKVIAVHAKDGYHGPRPEWITRHNIKIVPWAGLSSEL